MPTPNESADVNASTSARAVARRELTLAITTEARRQIADHGADVMKYDTVLPESLVLLIEA